MSLRVLATAYACEPGAGSEGGIGWNWVREIAQQHELTLITRENNVDAVRLAADQSNLRLRVVGFDLPVSLRFWKRGSRGALTYFALWQRGLIALAKELHAERRFDVTHHLTFASSWIGSGLSRVDAPFVWGPVGHHDPIPLRFQRAGNVIGIIGERAKGEVRRLLPSLDPLARETRERADLILSLGGDLPGHLSGQATDRVIPMLACGVDAPAASTLTLARKSPALEILFAGRLVDLKGPDLAIDAFAMIAGAHPGARLKLIGDGPRRSHLQDQVRSLGLTDRVSFLGQQSHDRTLQEMAAAHIFFFPSFEGAGMVVVEALAHACPVVCLDLGGPGRMVAGERGIAVPAEGDRSKAVRGLGQALDFLAQDEMHRANLAQNGRDWALREATWSAKGKRLNEFYDLAIDRFDQRKRKVA